MGLFLDIFFCGHYMNKGRKSFFGKQLLQFKLNTFSDNFVKDYIDNVSYKNKDNFLPFIIKKERKSDMYDYLYHVIEKEYNMA